MTLEPNASVSPAGAVITPGWSDAAIFVAERTEESRRQLQSSSAVGLGIVFNELCQVAEECEDPNWDGFGAEPVSMDAYRLAYQFLEGLPLGTPAPSIGAEPDGHITFEWHRGPERTLSVSVSPDAQLHFAARIRSARDYGTRPFFGEIPHRIFELIQRVAA